MSARDYLRFREPIPAGLCSILETLIIDAAYGGKDKSPLTEEQRNFLDPLGITSTAGTDFRATPPPINAAAFSNPSVSGPSAYAPARNTNAPGSPARDISTDLEFGAAGPDPGTGGGLRADLVGSLAGTNRAAPQAARVQAGDTPRLDTTALAPGQRTTAGALGQASGARRQQQDATGLLRAAATGAVPSAAEAQQQQGLASALRNNLAMAASARGTGASKVAAQRAALDANTAASLGVTGQAAQLRAQEQATARGQLSEAVTGIRSGDLATGQLGLGQQQVGLGAAQAQLGADTQFGLGQLGADQAVTIANLNAQLQQSGMNDAERQATLAKILQIDTNTMEGQMALQKLMADSALTAQQINADIATGNAAAEAQKRGGVSGGIGGVLGAIFG